MVPVLMSLGNLQGFQEPRVRSWGQRPTPMLPPTAHPALPGQQGRRKPVPGSGRGWVLPEPQQGPGAG